MPYSTDIEGFISKFPEWEPSLRALDKACREFGLVFYVRNNGDKECHYALSLDAGGNPKDQVVGVHLKTRNACLDIAIHCKPRTPWPGLDLWPKSDKGLYCHDPKLIDRRATTLPAAVLNAIESSCESKGRTRLLKPIVADVVTLVEIDADKANLDTGTGEIAVDRDPEGAQNTANFHTKGPTVDDDVNEILERADVGPTDKLALMLARVGQGKFRDDVLSKWNQKCAVTGASTLSAIRASHIKPWSESKDRERLDPYNGIPLIATLDALFDKGLISFDATGRMLVKESLAEDERRILGVSEERQICLPSDATAKYLEWHRKHFKFES